MFDTDGKLQFPVRVERPAPRPHGGAQAAQGSKSGAEGLLGSIEGAVERNL